MLDPAAGVDSKITLLGGAPVNAETIARALSFAPILVAADGGADQARAFGHRPSKIIGDLDSVTSREIWQDQGVELVEVLEQDSTDFEKCLTHTSAELYLGVGFLGGRVDHGLACLRALAAFGDKRILLLGQEDVVFLCPPKLDVALPLGTRVSFFPLGDCSGGPSTGLRWPVDDLAFAPSGLIGTSNEAAEPRVTAAFEPRVMLCLLPQKHLGAAIDALSG